MSECDDTRAATLAEQELLALRTTPEYQVGQLGALLTDLGRQLSVLARDVRELWSRSSETLEAATAARVAAEQAKAVCQGLGSTVFDEHEKTRKRIDSLPCRPNGGGPNHCGHGDTDPAPPLELVR